MKIGLFKKGLIVNWIENNEVFKTSYKKYYESITDYKFDEVKLNDLEEKWIISFEGIDATGKQTLSGLLQNYFNSLDPDEDICTKINIPDYDIPSGQEIKEILINGNYQPEYLQLKFALNRKEVQNRLILQNKILKKQNIKEKNIIIFDRWVDSGALYKVGKMVYEKIKSYVIEETPDINQLIIEELFNVKDYLLKQLELEHNTLQLVKPHLKILCTTPIKTVEKRLRTRLLEQGISEADIENHLDSHEKNSDLLYTVQYIYNFVYSNPKIFFPSEIFARRNPKDFLILDTSILNPEECINLILYTLQENYPNKN